ncbi:MAG: hypothetical protein SPG32_07690 [Candidatus Ventricola sp.]|nr:hypothetical protein [Candidatus Ventricola sp.]
MALMILSSAVCEHPKTQSYAAIPDTEKEYKPIEGNLHSYLALYSMTESCEICGTSTIVVARSEDYRLFTARHSYDLNGEEYVCVCGTVCDHSGSVGGDEYTEDDPYLNEGDTHLHSWRVYCDSTCPDCGYVEKKPLRFDSRSEEHSYTDGKCVCGAVECQHEDESKIDTSFDGQNYRVGEPLGGGMHKTYRDVYIQYRCNVCSRSWYSDEPVKTGVESTDPCYDAGNGKCVCGADYQACAHENKTAMTDRECKEVVSSDENGHTRLADFYTYEYCTDCHSTVGERTLLQQNATITERHSYDAHTGEDTICSTCGYTLACTHQNTDTGYGGVIVQKVISSDANQHTILCDRELVTHCEDCGQLQNRWIEQSVELTEDHDYDRDGVCRYCGNKNACAHSNKKKESYYSNERDVKYVDEATHSFYADKVTYWYCLDCHESFGYGLEAQNAYVQERHSYDDNGVCYTCRRKTTCTHEDARSWFKMENVRVTKKNGDGTHEIMYDQYIFHRCDRCGMRWQDAEPAWKDLTIVEDCWNEEGGLCIQCGMPISSQTCLHTNTFTEIHVDIDNCKVISKDDTYHVYQADVIEDTRCSDCYAEISSKTIQEKATFKERHDAWYSEKTEDGMACGLCGHAVPACGHEKATTELYREWNLPVTKVIKVTAEEHTVICDAQETTYCDDCDRELSTKALRNVELTAAHEYDRDGKCTACGYVNTCKHGNTKKETFYGLIRNLEMDERFHSFYADEWERTVCQDCGWWLGERVVKANQYVIESHKYGDDGKCTVCGCSMGDCAHEAAESTMAVANQRVTPNGNGTHTVTFDMYVHYSCPDCGAKWSLDEPLYTDLTSVDSCTFNLKGVCTQCGAKESEIVCKHPSLEHVRDIDYSTIQVISSDKSRHVLKADVVSYDFCPDCWAVLNYAVVQKGATFNESHEPYLAYDDEGAECLRCGYMAYSQSTCKHEKVSTTTIIREGLEPKGYTDITAKTHAAIYDVEEREECELCGKEFSRKVVLDAKVAQEHTYGKDNVCVECGYKNTCTHKNARTVTEYDLIHDARVESGSKHSFAADQWEQWICPDCGAHSEWKLIAENKRFEQAHSFNGSGVCTFCGTQKTSSSSGSSGGSGSSGSSGTPTVTPTPVPVKQGVVSALLEVVDDALLESRDADTVVLGTQEVLTAEEYSVLRTLTLQEQMLVTLSAIGLDDAVTDAVGTMRLELSDEAKRLMDEIAARIGSMTAQEKAEFEALLGEYFPVTERISGGTRVRSFSIDVQIVVDGFARVERYQFYLDTDGQWIFERVDLTAFGRVG